MKKFEFELSESLYEQSLQMIRTKQDLLKLLSYAIKFLVSSPIPQSPIANNKKLILYIDRMSRILFCVNEKIFTFQFPIQVQVLPNDADHLYLHFRSMLEIDSMISSLLLSIFNQEDFFDGTLESIDEKILEEIVGNEWEDVDLSSFCVLVKHLLFFEPGYLRYDHDIANSNGELHPEHHIDFFFSSNNSMKIGLHSEIESEWMLDMLNTRTNCRYIT